MAVTNESSATAAPLFSVLVPTRNRLTLLRRLMDGLVAQTSDLARVEVILAVDDDDHGSQAFEDARVTLKKVVLPQGSTMGRIAQAAFEASTGRYIVGMNDDIILRTRGWDDLVAATIGRHDDDIALLYGNDLLFGERLCTFPILSRRATLAIGLAPEIYLRYRIDDHIFDIYQLLTLLGYPRIYYMPEMVFEHDNYVCAGNGKDTQNQRTYVADEKVIAIDAATFDAHLEDRKAAALRLAELIEESARARRATAARTLLSSVHDSFSYRKPEAIAVVSGNNGRPQPARPTVVIVSADLRAAHARKCLASVKAHTTECDLLVLDNGRSGSFNHAREMNRAIEAARSDLIVFLDDDVVVEPGWIEGLSAALDERTAVVTPLHDNGRGRRSYSGGYLKGDGDGAHAHTLDRPSRVRGTQLACTAAMLVDRRKLPAIRFDEEYRKYFFDAAFTLKVWEAGYRAVCTPRVTVTHLGGATMPQGTTAVSKAAWERDRRIFVRDWVITGRFEALNRLGWQGDAYVKLLSEAPGRIDDLLERHRFDGGTPVVATLTRTWHRYRAFPLCQELLLDRLRSSAGFYASSHGAYRAIMRWAASHGVRESAAARKGARARARRLLRAVQTGSRVAVFGASPFGAECFQVCEAEGVSVDVFLDNHPDRQRSRFLGREVVAPQQFDVWEHRVDAVIVASQAHGAVMRKQLTRPGEVGVPIIDYFER